MRVNISLDEALSSRSKIKILSYLFDKQAPMTESELASVAGVSHMTANRIMKELNNLNLVSMTRVGSANVWALNSRSFAYKTLSRIMREVLLMPKPIDDLKQRIKRRIPGDLVEKIVLYGPVAASEETEESDINLFVQVKSDKEREDIKQYLDDLSLECSALYGKKLAPYVLTSLEYQTNSDHPVIKELDKGIVL